MDLPIENLLHHNSVEYLLLDSGLHITSMSPGAARLALDPQAVKLGNDARMAFPELVGAEAELQDVLDGVRPSWHLRGICRSDDPACPLYMSAVVELRRGAKEPAPSLAVMLEDVTAWMTAVQKSTQTMNDATMLLHALTVSKVYIEGILDAMADMLIVTSPDGTISAVNPATLATFGYASAEVIGQPFTTLLAEEQSQEAAQALPGALDGSDSQLQPHDMPARGRGNGRHNGNPRFEKIELRCRSWDGIVFPVSFTRAPLDIGDGVPRGLVYVGRDLREQREAEAKISRLETENLSLHEALSADVQGAEIVGSSPAMKHLMANLVKVAGTDTTVLITGETGTGKELVARAIHRLSRRSDRMLVCVNCAGLPVGLVESELFGHEKGAFTGAMQKRIGRFELADGGTVFLDEVAELPPAAQAMLLRVLQEQEFERVGGSRPVSVDVRVIAATNRDLSEEVRKGRFREDLLFRLNVFPLHAPALRERPTDIPVLAEHFVRLFAKRMNKSVTGLTQRAIDALARYRWPGNVRELANVVERAMIVRDRGLIDASDLGLMKQAKESAAEGSTLNEVAREHILHTLEECGGLIEGPQGAAARLGLNPGTLRSRMKKLGISRTRGGFTAGPAR